MIAWSFPLQASGAVTWLEVYRALPHGNFQRNRLTLFLEICVKQRGFQDIIARRPFVVRPAPLVFAGLGFR